ncbi:NAD(P)-dependent oxidoreductase [Leptolyngbya valderiana BDU 20041]|nr:NAD(P)-dependent oxidoreductase [Leptolyngbya valderiana BDU 20041]
MTNVAILGCGYVGLRVAEDWKQQGLTVTATTTSRDRIPELETVSDRARVVRGDNREELAQLLEGQDSLLVSVSTKRRQTYNDAYLQTAKTLVSVLDGVPTLKQVLYTSSCSVYGDFGGDWVDETTPVKPGNPNAEVLAETERVLLEAATDTRSIGVLRLGGIYGPGREIAKIYSRMAGTTQPGDGLRASNWVHLDDIVGAIAFAERHRLDGIYNVVDDDVQPTRELVENVCRTHSLPPVTWDASQPGRSSYNAKVSNEKLKRAGYSLIHPKRIV